VFAKVGLLPLPYPRLLTWPSCTHSNSEGGFCSTDRIEESQNKSGTNYTTTNAFAFLPELFTSGLAVLLPPQTACDNCSKATLNLILSEAPWNISNTENTTISDTCGSSFLGRSSSYLSLASMLNGFLQMAKNPQIYQRSHLVATRATQAPVPQPRAPSQARLTRMEHIDRSRYGMD